MTRAARIVPQATQDGQARAADPRHSAWVSANAGSGKTKVLVDRVLRLLLAGVEPARILCLTYTKATAANMANKVFAQLAAWTTMGEAPLRAAVTELMRDPDNPSGKHPSPQLLVSARRLFATALETPGGLQIETIHAFCTRVLQMAPFEANVPARFEVMDENQRQELMRAARHDIMSAALLDPQAPLGLALGRIAEDAGSDEQFAEVLDAALKSRADFLDVEGVLLTSDQIADRTAQALAVPATETTTAVATAFLETVERLLDVDHVIDVCTRAGGTTDLAIADAARAARLAAGPVEAARVWLDRLLNDDATKVHRHLGTAKVLAIDPSLREQLSMLAGEALAASDRLKAIDACARTRALATVAAAVFARYDAAKLRAGLLDYDDLITATRSVLSRVGASWVLYKLDSRVDHVLVDEAQDTTPAQWEILRSLTAEFTAGAGARATSVTRTLFAVGDQKQSIYGFQGAAPEKFDDMRRFFRARTQQADRRFNDIQLTTSFRSVPDIVAAVDAIFAPREHWAGLVSEEGLPPQRHDTARVDDGGAVDIWPIAADDPDPDSDAWSVPLDGVERRRGVIVLARRIAALIRQWSAAGRDDLGQAFAPGDVLILLRKRGAQFEAIVKALKDANVPVAGRDRLKLAVHPAVEDMLVLGRAIRLPDDDLSVATLLRTPLFDLDDDDLLGFAPERTGSLLSAFRLAARTGEKLARADSLFSELTDLADQAGPFAFFAHVLGPLGGRYAALRRLGAEAGDALDAFLSSALDHERRHGPSLDGFLLWTARSTQDVKRDLSGPANEVRVMTVHGAKGLESKIVVLADLGKPNGGRSDVELIGLPVSRGNQTEFTPVWSPRRTADSAVIAQARAAKQAKLREEHNRLLYVALTRAENRLIICGAGATNEPPAGSWYETIERGLLASQTGLAEIPAPDSDGTIRRFKTTPMTAEERVAAIQDRVTQIPPDWLEQSVPAEAGMQPPLSPSSAARAADMPNRPLDHTGLSGAAAAGRFAHLLLQILPGVPAALRERTAIAVAASRAAGLDQGHRDAIIRDALGVLSAPDLVGLFGPDSLAEVPVAGHLMLADGTRRAVSGQIDRLCIGPERVIVADYKTTSHPPSHLSRIPVQSLVQMAVYRDLMAAIFPGRPIRPLLVYTADLSVLEPSDAQLDAALAWLAANPWAAVTPA